MEAILLCLLLNEIHLFSLTLERFILNHNVNYTFVLYDSART